MDIKLLEQANAMIGSSQTPVIIIPKHPSADALAAALGLLLVLERNGKNARVVSPEFSLPATHSFLPKSDAIQQDLESLQNFIINVNLKRAKLESLSYDIQDDQLHIHLTPKQGSFRPEDVRSRAGDFAYDLIILLDLPNLERLGPLYEQNTEFFLHTPILNIDHHAENRRYGHTNLVDVVASSVSEILFELVRRLGTEYLDEQVATSLLTGIISKTKTFQARSVTPRSLAIASHLVTSGARRDEIIRNLYQTKNIRTLNLWGRALSRLVASEDQRVIWSSINKQDLEQFRVSASEAAGVLDELMINAPGATFVVLFIEQAGHVVVHLNHDAATETPKLPPEIIQAAPQYFTGAIPGTIDSVITTILGSLGSASPNPSTQTRT